MPTKAKRSTRTALDAYMAAHADALAGVGSTTSYWGGRPECPGLNRRT